MYAALDRFTDSTCIKPSALLFIDKVQIHISVSHISRFDASAVIRRHARFDGLGHLRKLEIRGQIECLENPAYVVAILAQIESEKSIIVEMLLYFGIMVQDAPRVGRLFIGAVDVRIVFARSTQRQECPI